MSDHDRSEKPVYRVPRIARRNRDTGETWEEEIALPSQFEPTHDDLLYGLTNYDVSGPGTGFAAALQQHLANQQRSAELGRTGMRRQAGTGAGPDVTYRHEPQHDYSLAGGNGPISQTDDIDEDPGTMDLFGEPATHPRREYYDPAGGYGDRERGDSDYLDPLEYFSDQHLNEELYPDGRRPTPRRREDENSTFAKRRF